MSAAIGEADVLVIHRRIHPPGSRPAIARQADCQTCFTCEGYGPADALYVAPDCDGPVAVDEAEILASFWLGQYRRDSGWGDQPQPNESWRMDEVFARARASLTFKTKETAS